MCAKEHFLPAGVIEQKTGGTQVVGESVCVHVHTACLSAS